MLLSSWIISDKISLLIWNCLSSIWVYSCSCWQTETQLIYWMIMLLNQVWSSIKKVYHALKALLTWVWNWATVMSSLIKTKDVLRVYQDWLELINDLVEIWSRSDSDLTQIWLNTLFLSQHFFSFSTLFSFINILFIYIIFFSCHKHISFKFNTIFEHYINRSFYINLLLYF